MWRGPRIAVLLTVLFAVAVSTWVDRRRTTDWDSTLWIGIFPIAADAQATTRDYVDGLTEAQFADLEPFFAREARSHGVALERPVKVVLQPRVADAPPRLAPVAGVLATMAWSLRMRWYAWRHQGDSLADIRMFVLYHDPERSPAVPHSLGLQKGLLGVVYAFADESMDGENAIVIAHEALHTLGATDKYDLATGQPIAPDGLGDPDQEPRYPQQVGELMAGRVAVSPQDAEIPAGLGQMRVGETTAREIGWVK